MTPVRTVVVGAGHLGCFHLKKLAVDSLADLVGVVDVDPEKRRRVEQEFGVVGSETLSAFEGQAEAAVIAAPTVYHVELAKLAIQLEMHVLVEKPVAPSADEGRELVAAAEAADRILQVGHVERFNPAVAAALQILERPGYIVAERLGPFSGRSTDIDVVLDLMVHDLDLVAAMVPYSLKEARAVGVPMFTAETDMAAARLEFENGSVAQISASRGSLEPSRKIRVFTQDRYVSIDCQNREVKSIRRNAAKSGDVMELTGEPIEVADGDALALQDHDFLRCIREGQAPRVDGHAGVRALELAEAVKNALTNPIRG